MSMQNRQVNIIRYFYTNPFSVESHTWTKTIVAISQINLKHCCVDISAFLGFMWDNLR